MLHQYYAQRRLGGFNPFGVGTLAVGQIIYLQDFQPLGGIRGGRQPVCREPWIVESFANREYHPAAKGRPATTYCAGGHLVTVRSLRSGRRQQVSDWLVIRAVDFDLEWGGQRSAAARRRIGQAGKQQQQERFAA